jgi:hypothetical protein
MASRTSWGTQASVRVPQALFLIGYVPPSIRRRLSMDPNRYEVSEPEPLRGRASLTAVVSSPATMHECVSGLSVLPRSGPDLTPDDTLLCHPHNALVRHAVPSQTTGPRNLGLKPYRSHLHRRQRLLRAAATVSELIRPGRCPLHDHDRNKPRRSSPLDPFFTTARDGASKPPYLFKTTTVHHRVLHPSTTASRSSRIKPLLEVLSAAVNGSPRSVSLNKTTTEHDSPSPPSTTACPAPLGPLSDLLFGYRGRLLQDRHDCSVRHTARPRDSPDTPATHDRPFRSSSRSRSR